MLNADDVLLTILTGERPVLLDDTLASVREHAPGLLETAHVIAIHNGGDRDTAAILADHADVIDRVDVLRRLIDMGPAVSRALRLARTVDRIWWLHLEDDWRAHDAGDWLTAARRIFTVDPDVCQVRLRLASERVLLRHMVTHERLRWKDRDWYRVAPDVHYTVNPSLVRLADAADAWPAPGERTAQRQWHAAGHRRVAQLIPGVFEHTGGDQSLRIAKGMEL